MLRFLLACCFQAERNPISSVWFFPALLVGVAFCSRPASAAVVVVNEILTRNRLVLQDEDGDSSDWIELYNPTDRAVDLSGFGLTDAPGSGTTWRFPVIVLKPRSFLLVWCSGKNRTEPSRESVFKPDSLVPFETVIVGKNHRWKFLLGAPEHVPPPIGWNELDYDDRGWGSGLPGFGFGDNDDTTVFPRGVGTVYLRCRFGVEDPGAFENLILEVRYDDGFVAYLNGKEILKVNYDGDGVPNFSATASRSHEAKFRERFDLTRYLEDLKPGDNLLAVALLNRSMTNPDLSFDPVLGVVGGVLHTNFRLSSGGERLILTDRRGQVLDFVVLGPQARDHSYGRVPDGTGPFRYLLKPSPGAPNTGPNSAELIPDEPQFDPPGGWYDSPPEVSVSASFPFGTAILRYSLNGLAVTERSTEYTGPFSVSRTGPVSAALFVDAEKVMPTVAHTYFIRVSKPSLPVFAITMDPADFRYVHLTQDARGIGSERPAFLEIFDRDGIRVLGTGFGLRLHGGAGRKGDMQIKKAYKAYFRSKYGDPVLEWRVIPSTPVDRFDKLVLRSNFNDAFRTGNPATLMRDQIIRDLHEEMGGTVSHGAWYHLYVNGQYRGIYNVVERMDKVFLASYFPQYGENWDVIKTRNDLLDGDMKAWSATIDFFRRNRRNLNDEELYRQAASLIDIEDFTAYVILNIWSQNHDWPHNNWYMARPRVPDGRWIFLVWDAEFGIGRNPQGFSADTLSHVLGRADSPLGTILDALLSSEKYRSYFWEKTQEFLDTVLSPENVIEHIRELHDLLAPDMPRELALVGRSMTLWERNVQALETFALRRPDVVRSFIARNPRFGFPSITNIYPTRVALSGRTTVKVRGYNFVGIKEVSFNGISSPAVEVVSSFELRAEIPLDPEVEGTPTVTVLTAKGRAERTGLLRIEFVAPQVFLLSPDRGGAGDVVRIFGKGFLPGVGVDFGGVPAPSVNQVPDQPDVIEAVVPPGSGTVEVVVYNTVPRRLPAAEILSFTYVGEGYCFIRGDCSGDGRISVSDAVWILRYLYGGSPSNSGCLKAADVDDSGKVELADSLRLLGFLFAGGAAPERPFPACGGDPTPDDLTCAAAAP